MQTMNMKRQKHLRHAEYTQNSSPVSPKSITHSVLKADEIVLVLSHQVTCVEIRVSFLYYIPHELFLSKLFAPSIAKEWTLGIDFGQQQTHFTWEEASQAQFSNDDPISFYYLRNDNNISDLSLGQSSSQVPTA